MTVFTHVTVGTNDLEQARTFYDKVLGALGMTRLYDADAASAWGVGQPSIMVLKPKDGKEATRANGGTIGLAAPSREAVNNFHAEALANGGTCDGPPGPRDFVPNAYGAYVRDAVGNKFCAYCFAPE